MNYIESVVRGIRRQVPEDWPPKGDLHLLFRIYALLALAKGEVTTPEDIRMGGLMAQRNPHHSAITPYGQLS